MNTTARWLHPASPSGERPVLFCFPFAGGSELVYRDWGPQADSFDVVAVCPPGRGANVALPLLRTVPVIARAFIEAARPQRYPTFALFGHSLGGQIAYEVARQLVELGQTGPDFLAVSASPSPRRPPLEPLHLLDDPQLIRHLIEVDGAPQSLAHPDVAEFFLPILRADLQAGYDFHDPGHPPLPCPIVGFRGSDDPRVATEDVEDWGALTPSHVGTTVLPGGHLFIEEQAPAVLSRLEEAFNRRHPRLRSRTAPAS